ncbi:MAG: chemotaxis protein CheX [Candidatus Aureabacteria bacterium]|nr:chemotaxis protein CheX [Candidatus Auribacterota bacterium]
MDIKLINPFISSTITVLQTTAQLDAERGKLFMKTEDSHKSDISGVIGVMGKFVGSISISFPKNIALKVVSNMLGGMEIEGIDDSVKDAIGEVANMVAGAAKTKLAGIGYSYTLSIPTVICGDGHHLSFPKGIQSIVMPFNIKDMGDFYLEVALKMLKE